MKEAVHVHMYLRPSGAQQRHSSGTASALNRQMMFVGIGCEGCACHGSTVYGMFVVDTWRSAHCSSAAIALQSCLL